MPSAEFRVRVLLSPGPGARQPWPCPAGVTLQLKRKGTGARSAGPLDLTTGAGGITGPEELRGGTSYQVQITDPRFHLWQPAGDLDVSTPAAEAAAAVVRVPARGRDAAAEDEAVEKAAEEALAEAAAAASAPPLLDVTLVPQAGRRLVVVRRVTDDGQPVTAGMVTIRSAGTGFSEPFSSFADGNVYAVAPIEAITVDLASPELREQMLCPQAFQVPYTVVRAEEVRPLEFIFWPAVQIVAKPIITDSGGGKAPLYGATVQVQHQVNGGDVVSRVKTLEQDPSDPSGEVWFEYYLSGEYDVTVKPPDPTYQGLPISPREQVAEVPLVAPFRHEAQADFHVVPTEPLTVGVQLPLGKQQLTGPAEFEVYNGGTNVTVSVDPEKLEGTVAAPKDIPLKIRPGAGAPPMVEGDSPRIGAVPLQMSDPDQAVVPGPNTVVLTYEHSRSLLWTRWAGPCREAWLTSTSNRIHTPWPPSRWVRMAASCSAWPKGAPTTWPSIWLPGRASAGKAYPCGAHTPDR
jgi:hypothetical protein